MHLTSNLDLANQKMKPFHSFLSLHSTRRNELRYRLRLKTFPFFFASLRDEFLLVAKFAQKVEEEKSLKKLFNAFVILIWLNAWRVPSSTSDLSRWARRKICRVSEMLGNENYLLNVTTASIFAYNNMHLVCVYVAWFRMSLKNE